MKVDILAIGVHPDDVELGCSGTLLQSVKQGKKVAVVDLTRGELGSRGTADTRMEEAAKAAVIMQLSARENLGLRDGFFTIEEAATKAVISVIRKYRPEVVLCNAPKDRHPDHGRSSQLVTEACFLSGLTKIETSVDGQLQEAWRPKQVFHYMQDLYIEPDFVFDISDSMGEKVQAILAYETQFNVAEPGNEPSTYISDPAFLEALKGRAGLLGKRVGVRFAEGFLTNKTLGIRDFESLVNVVR